LLENFEPSLEVFKLNKSKPEFFQYGIPEKGFGFSREYSALAYKAGNIKVFEVEKMEHRYGWSDSECANLDDRRYSLVATGIENQTGRFTIKYDVEFNGNTHMSNNLYVPQILKHRPNRLVTTGNTVIEFIPNQSTNLPSFSLKLGDIDPQRKITLNEFIDKLIKLWPEIEKHKQTLEEEKKRADDQSRLKKELTDEKAELDKLKSSLKK
jgi:hypothetical protein